MEAIVTVVTFACALYCACTGCKQDAQPEAASPATSVVNETMPTVLVEEDDPPTYHAMFK